MRRRSMLRQRALWFSLALSLGCLFVIGASSHAAGPTSFSVESVGSKIGLGDADLKQVVYNIIRWVLGILTLVAVSYMIYGGYVWLTAAGNEQRVEKAKQIILQAAIGLVIVLLAWAIVLFVAKTFFATTTDNPGGGGGDPPCVDITDCVGGADATFDVTAINTCAVPKSYQDVPRSSAVSMTFNSDLKTNITNLPQDTVSQAVTSGKLQIEKCIDAACTNTISPNPKPIANQIYTPGGTTAGTKTAPLAEWLAINNTLTFYHLSFSDVPADTSYRLFEANTTYRVTIPKDTTNNGLKDVRDRILSYCRSNPTSVGNDITNCQDSTDGKSLEYIFTTGTSASGQPLAVTTTTPSSDYLTVSSAIVDRNVPRSTILAVNFDGAVDPVSATTANFRVYKISAPSDPAKGTCGGGPCTGGTQLDPNDFDIRVNGGGTGILLQLKNNTWFDAFTWYRVEVENIHNLCGTTAPKQTWVFETNDVTPGVQFVYPSDGFANACPSTEVFAQFRTSMLDITQSTTACHEGTANSYSTRALVADTSTGVAVGGRSFDFTDQPPAGNTDPNTYCKHLSFDPTSSGLVAGNQYNAGIISNRVIDQNGNKLEYGSAVPGFTPQASTPAWQFTVQAPNKCANAPYITRVTPGEDVNGACVTVQGNYFTDPNKPAPPAYPRPSSADELKFGAFAQSSSEIKSWDSNNIVNRLNSHGSAAGIYQYQVTVDYASPIGPLTSNKSDFKLNAGAASNRPCLYSLTPNQGFPSSTFSADGEHFGGDSGAAKVLTDNPLGTSSWGHGTWTDTSVSDISVPPKPPVIATTTQVQIVSSSGQKSNALQYKVLDPNTGGGPGTDTGAAPEVDESATCNIGAGAYPSPNPYKGDTTACLNTAITVRFKAPLDPTTVTNGTVGLYACPGGVCSPVTPLPTVQPTGNLITITPGANLLPSMTYEVRLTTGIKAVPIPPGGPGSGTAMASVYSYQFTTKAGSEPCIVDNVGMNPNGSQTTNNPNYSAIDFQALPMDNACHTLNHNGLLFTWSSSNTLVGALTPNIGPDHLLSNTIDDAKKLSPPPLPGILAAGSTDVQVSLQSHTSPKFTLTYGPTACTMTSQCACGTGTSQCVGGQCQPIVTSMVSDNGPIGTWTTINGCWFGTTPGTVKYYHDLSTKVNGVVPNPAQCGNGTWTNTEIISEVPNTSTSATTDDAGLGRHPVDVIRADSVSTTFAGGFDVNTAQLGPSICKVAPNVGYPNDAAVVTGRGFTTQQAADKVTFKFASTSPIPVSSLSAWTDTSINIRVPNAVTVGDNDVQVVKGSMTSNPKNYTVLPPSIGPCMVACSFGPAGDALCNSQTAGTACGYNGCCAVRPKVLTVNPPNSPTAIMCRNIVPQISFDQPLDQNTVNTSNVRYFDGVRRVDGNVSVDNSGGQGNINYQPGVLTPNMTQSIKLSTVTETIDPTFENPSFEDADASGVPTNTTWQSLARVKQSLDLPPGSGHGAHSVLADCANCATGDQAFAAQTLPNGEPVGTSFHVTGWVKVEAPAGVEGGLITQCMNPSFNNCGFETTNFPGHYTGNSNGWKFVDVVVTKSANAGATLHVNCYANAKAKVWCDDITVSKLTPPQTALIRGASGALADVSFPAAGSGTFAYNFKTGTNYCAVDTIAVDPSSDIFTSAGEQHPATATALGLNGTVQVSQVPLIYTWSWSWLSGNTGVVTAAQQGSGDPSNALITAVANGHTNVTAKAHIDIDTTPNHSAGQNFQGAADERVAFCVKPWQLTNPGPTGFTDTQNNCDINNGGPNCPNYNFKLFYCRDGSTTLPNFIYTGAIPSAAPGILGSIEGLNTTDAVHPRLKSFFFKESATSRDTIGLLIFKNDDFLSPYDWFTKQFPLDKGGSSTTVAGYPAVKTGTTTYVGVTNLEGGALKGLMFVFDYNSNSATSDTVNIANQMLDTLTFNTNLSNATQKEQLVRDTKRLQDLRSIKVSLDAYKTKNGAYPTLASGTYIPGFTTSLWPSWQTTLGSTIGKTVPTDPLNTFATPCTGNFESGTCWSEKDKQFSCTGTSSLYAVRSNGTTVDLYGSMEYSGTPNLKTVPAPTGVCSSPSTCDCFNFKLP